ncbi:MAG: DUF6015 family protein, partial [Candidatus Lutacidiplasmatales archaeon]
MTVQPPHSPISDGGHRYTLRNPVPLRTAADLSTTRAGIPQDATIQFAGPVDHDSLAKAIRRSVGHDGMRPEDARSIAAHVLNFFGFNERIIDNVLEADDRDTFYMLEDSGILETERDETTLYDGREWRIHYWMFRKDRIFDLAREESQAMAEAGEQDLVYSSNANRSGGFRLPHGEHGTGLAAHAVYHELGDELWLERKTSPST